MALKRFLRRHLISTRLVDPYFISHSTLSAAIRRVSQNLNSCKWLLDIGCGQKPYRPFFKTEFYIGVDLPTYGPQAADVFASALQLPFGDNSFDIMLCTEVLEHVPDPDLLFGEIARLLKSDGTLVLTTPQTWGLHLEPFDYFRYTRYGLHLLAERAGLKVQFVEPTCGIWATLGQRAVDAIYARYGAGKPFLVDGMVRLVCAIWNTISLGLDRLDHHGSDTLDNILVARKTSAV